MPQKRHKNLSNNESTRLDELIESLKFDLSPDASSELLDVADAAEAIHMTAMSKGWWPEGKRDFAEATFLIITELAEGMEEHRNNHPDGEIRFEDEDHIQVRKPLGFAIEMADAVIRLLDTAKGFKIPVNLSVPKLDLDDNAIRSIETKDDMDTLGAEMMLCTNQLVEAFGAYLLGNSPNARQDPNIRSRAAGRVSNGYAHALIHIANMCKSRGFSLAKAVRIKAAYNLKRPYRHGGKSA